MAIGLKQARNMMRQLGWKMRVALLGDSVEKIVLIHPRVDREYKVRTDSGRKLMRECVLRDRLDSQTAILEYCGTEFEVTAPRWYAATRWAVEDVVAAAEAQGVTLTEERAVAWWKRNESRFQNILTEYGNEILSHMDFEEVM